MRSHRRHQIAHGPHPPLRRTKAKAKLIAERRHSRAVYLNWRPLLSDEERSICLSSRASAFCAARDLGAARSVALFATQQSRVWLASISTERPARALQLPFHGDEMQKKL